MEIRIISLSEKVGKSTISQQTTAFKKARFRFSYFVKGSEHFPISNSTILPLMYMLR